MSEVLHFNEKGQMIDSNGNVILEKNNLSIKSVKQQITEKKEEELNKNKKQWGSIKQYTKYEVTPETTFEIRFGIVLVENRWIIINEDEVEFTKGAEKHWVKFRMWTFKEELGWKNEATEYDNIKKIHSLNADKLNELKIRNLLLDWSFAKKDDNLRLLHVNGILCDESFQLVYSLYPNIVRYIIERMNEVLELNG